MGSRGSTAQISPWRKLKQHFREAFSEQFAYQRNFGDSSGSGHTARKRGRDAYRYIMLLLVFILAPMFSYNLYSGQLLLSVACLSLLLLILVNIWLLGGDRQALLRPAPLLGLSILLILFAVSLGQNDSVYWLYPLLAGLPVLLHPRQALTVGLVSAVVTLPILFLRFDTGSAIVLGCSMTVTWLVSAWMVFAVTEQSRRLRDMAVTDPLTGAYNRRYLEEQASHAVDAWRRHRQASTLLLLDVDHFKRVNDRFGHAVGDTAIKRLVEVISQRLRAVDTLCRFGGEEFVVLLHDTGAEGATRLAEELRERVERTRILPEGNMTVSIGVCEVIAAEDVDHWFKLADAALYLAKRNGRNRVEVARQALAEREPIARTVPDWR